ncbi:MAG: sigma-70 family RNA polymerase sigma factor [Acidobacteriota bacterium]
MEGKKATDSELIQQCLAGQEQAWIELIDRYKALIYSIPIKHGLDRELTADIFQSVCYKLFKSLASLREHERLIGWIVTTTTRECWRARTRYNLEAISIDEPEPAFEPVDTQQLPDLLILEYEQQLVLHQAMAELPPRCQQLLRLLFFEREQQSYEAIGQQLGMPAASIGPTRARCLQKLKEILKGRI